MTALPSRESRPRERPIVFSAPMVRAILDNRKTQTRRVVTPRTAEVGSGLPWGRLEWDRVYVDPGFGHEAYLKIRGPDETLHRVRCRWQVGDRLWVRETFFDHGPYPFSPLSDPLAIPLVERVEYRAEPWDRVGDPEDAGPWTPSIFMPRWASRITLEITDVRVERVHDISEADAIAEGVQQDPTPANHREHYRVLWNDLNAKRGLGWSANPWVWVIHFRYQPGDAHR